MFCMFVNVAWIVGVVLVRDAGLIAGAAYYSRDLLQGRIQVEITPNEVSKVFL